MNEFAASQPHTAAKDNFPNEQLIAFLVRQHGYNVEAAQNFVSTDRSRVVSAYSEYLYRGGKPEPVISSPMSSVDGLAIEKPKIQVHSNTAVAVEEVAEVALIAKHSNTAEEFPPSAGFKKCPSCGVWHTQGELKCPSCGADFPVQRG